MSTGNINVVLNLNSAGFTAGINGAQHSLNGLNVNLNNTIRNSGSASSGFSGMASSLHGVIINAALAGDALRNIHAVTTGVMLGIANTNGELERMQMLMTGMSKASTQAMRDIEGATDMKFVLDMAKNSPVALKGLTDAFVKLKTTGIDPTTGSMQALVDANSHFGGNADSLKRASIAISQMMSKTKVSMEELRQQLAEAIPNASALMARGMGMSMEDFIKAVSKGTVNSKEALTLMYREMERDFAGSSDNMMKSWTGMTSQLETEWMLFQKQIGDAGFFEAAKNALGELVAALKTDEMAAFGAEFGHTLTTVLTAIANFTKAVVENRAEISKWVKIGGEALLAFMAWKKIVEVIVALEAARVAMFAATAVIPGLIAGLGSLGIAMTGLTGPIGLVAAAVVGGIIVWQDWGNSAKAAIADVTQAVNDGSKLTKAQQDVIDEAKIDGARAGNKLSDMRNGDIIDNIFYFREKSKEGLREKVRIAAEMTEGEIKSKVANEKRLASAQVEAQDEAFKKINQNAVTNSQKKAIDNYNTNGAGKQDRGVFYSEKNKIEVGVFEEQIKGVAELSDKLIKEAEAAGRSTVELRKNKEERILSLQVSKNSLLESNSGFTPDTKKKDKAAKDAQAAEDKALNVTASLRARLAKVNSNLSQPITKGADMVGPGPELAKLLALETGTKRFSAEDKKLATQLDEGNKAWEERVKAVVALDGTQRNVEKNVSKSNTDLKHSQDVLANGGYETMSKATLRYNEQMDIQNDKLNSLRENFKGAEAEFETRAAGIRKGTEEALKNAAQTDANNNNSAGLRNARVINAGLIGNTSERLNAQYNLEVEAYKERNSLAGLSDEEIKRTHAGMYAEMLAMANQHARDTEHPIATMGRQWEDVNQNMKMASADWLNGFSEQLTSFVTTGKADFAGLAKSIIADITRMIIQMMIMKTLKATFGATLFADGGVMTPDGPAPSSPLPTGAEMFPGSLGKEYANGGIMSSAGDIPLRAYASGGIANSPQMAIFGEGRMNEAYVPLPDGKTIPVTMKGGQAGGGETIIINVNVDNKGGSSEDKKGSGTSDAIWKQMAENVKGVVMTTIAQEKRPGGQLA